MKQTQAERDEERQSKKAFTWLIANAKKRGALHSVEIINTPIIHTKKQSNESIN